MCKILALGAVNLKLGIMRFHFWTKDFTEGEKNHKKGGLNCVFGNFFFYVLDNCPQVQSLK